MASSSEIQTQDLLDAVTSGIQAGELTETPPAEVHELVGTIQALHVVLTPVEPRPEFVESLRTDIIQGRPGVIERAQQMPVRISVAAALALVAGCLLFFLRRLFDSDAPQAARRQREWLPRSLKISRALGNREWRFDKKEIQEEAVATPL
ncbi:MAG: hypothetical protein J4G18_06110 [Anaerolineae bacterium]|nr:hypothetical protein [Anaerolineae bacterium]